MGFFLVGPHGSGQRRCLHFAKNDQIHICRYIIYHGDIDNVPRLQTPKPRQQQLHSMPDNKEYKGSSDAIS